MLVGVLFLAACSSDDDADGSGSSTTAPADVSATDQAGLDPDDPDQSEPDETSSTDTTGDELAEGDNAEGDNAEETEPRDQVAIAVEMALNEGHLAFLEVISEPVGTDLDELSRWFDVDRSATIGEFVASIQEAGIAVRRGDLALEQIVVESVELVSPELADVVYCLSTDSVVYDVTDGEVVDDSVGAFRYNTLMSLEGGVWKDGVQELIEFFVGPDCLTTP